MRQTARHETDAIVTFHRNKNAPFATNARRVLDETDAELAGYFRRPKALANERRAGVRFNPRESRHSPLAPAFRARRRRAVNINPWLI